MADNDYPPSPWSPADKKTRSQLRMISTCSRVTFLRYYNSSRKTEDADDKPPREGEASCGPKSGVLVRKPPPKTHKQLPAWEFRPAKKHHAYYFHRHTQWMHAPYESLAKSPLNNTPTRAMMPARLKASLRGSPALHVTAQFPGPQRINPLRAFGSIAPGSAPDEVKVYDQRYRNHPTDLMYYLPPPALRSRPGWDLCRVAHEIRYAMKYQDTEEMRLDMKKALSDLADEIDQTHYAIGPTPRDYQRWRETVERGRVDLAHSNKAYKLKFYSRDAQERCGIHIDDMKRLVRRARYAVRSYGPILPPASHSAGAAGYAQSNQPRTSAPVAQLSDAQRPVNTFRQLPTAHPVRFRPRTSAPHTVEQVLQAGSLTAATSSTPGPPALSPATPVSGSFTTTQSSSVPVASDSSSSPPPVSPSPKPRRERMPRIELSPRRLRSTTKVLMEPVVLALSSGAPVVARTRRVRLRVQAPKDLPAPRKPTTDASKAKRLRAAKAAASSALEQPAYIQTRYNLRVRKRKCDEESEPAPAVNNPPAPRPIKRRRN
ncbi:hypothetical protein BDV93DRAFT_71871 [Ceratobasidium sp. AG-I]|nr:hypothetical protein BDV93DRAFT_71871 [Ceratobasidium sp. AG-I]